MARHANKNVNAAMKAKLDMGSPNMDVHTNTPPATAIRHSDTKSGNAYFLILVR